LTRYGLKLNIRFVNLKQLREQHDISQFEAAVKAGVHPGTVAELEQGRMPNPTLGTLQGLARAYQVSLTKVIQALSQSVKDREVTA
jgi:transcriptional regulator with XRE-family HTH domain